MYFLKYKKYKKLYSRLKAGAHGAHITETLLDGTSFTDNYGTAEELSDENVLFNGQVYELKDPQPGKYTIKILMMDGEEINIEYLTNKVSLDDLKEKIQEITGIDALSYILMNEDKVISDNTITLIEPVTNISLMIQNYVTKILTIKNDWTRRGGYGEFLSSFNNKNAEFNIKFNDDTNILASGKIINIKEGPGGESSYADWSFNPNPDIDQIKQIVSYMEPLLSTQPDQGRYVSVALYELLDYLKQRERREERGGEEKRGREEKEKEGKTEKTGETGERRRESRILDDGRATYPR